ncbi:hypothetical protein BSKO_07074 [Bryopsis sp. KO-2023]|nr:hypothetical protein BSKO_07074 [Bryopsis sp. KO-2023]
MLAWMGGKRKKFELWKKANGGRGSERKFAADGFSEQYTRLASLGTILEGSPKNKSKPPRTLSLGARGYATYESLIDDCENSDAEEPERQVAPCVEEVVEVSNAVRRPAVFFSPDSIDSIDEGLDARAMHSFPESDVLVGGAEVAPTNQQKMLNASKTINDRGSVDKKRPKLILKKRARSAGRSLDLCMISMDDLE